MVVVEIGELEMTENQYEKTKGDLRCFVEACALSSSIFL
jgi:hypothetical protein